MNIHNYINKINGFMDVINSDEDKFIKGRIATEKEMFRSLLHEINNSSDNFIIKGAIVPRDVLMMWYFPFYNLVQQYNDNNINDDLWKEIADIFINGFQKLYQDPKYFDQQKILDTAYKSNKPKLFLNASFTIDYLRITGSLILLLSMGINIFIEDFGLVNTLQQHIYKRMSEVLDFEVLVKVNT